jgi:glucose-1-phosphate thymidylyltransferase
LLGDGRELGVKRLSYAYQAQAGGIAEALGLTENFVDGDKFLVMLGDNILEHSIEPFVDNFKAQEGGARVLLKEMEDPQHLRHLGVPIIEDGRILSVLEKPQNPPSQYAVIGAYMYSADVFDIVKTLRPSGRGELEITDVNNAFIERGAMEYDVIEGFWGDAGESIEVYYEIIDFVRANGVNKKSASKPAGVA